VKENEKRKREKTKRKRKGEPALPLPVTQGAVPVLPVTSHQQIADFKESRSSKASAVAAVFVVAPPTRKL